MLSLMSTFVDMAHWPITVSCGVPLDCLIIFQNVFDVPLLVLFIVSNIYLPNIIDHLCVSGFNNSLDGGYCIKWRTVMT